MEETKINPPVAATCILSTANVDTTIVGGAAMQIGTGTSRQQQRRLSNLLQCMDQDGNIDAFRYIEYSRQRRIEFLRRADFICKMKSTLLMQHQHQRQQQQQHQNQQLHQQQQLHQLHHQLHRSAFLPGMTMTMTMTNTNTAALPVVQSSMANEVFVFNDTRAGSVSPETTGSMLKSNMPKSLGATGHRNKNTNTGTVPAALPDAHALASAPVFPLIARSMSMPFVSSFVTHANTNNGRNNAEFETTVSHGSVSQQQQTPQRRRLRKEEFEAAEALLFGMGRRGSTDYTSTSTSLPGGRTGSRDKRSSDGSSTSSSEDDDGATDAEDDGQSCIGGGGSGGASKKRKISDLPRVGIHSRSEEMESV
jgi:hypothetical protein